MRLPSRSEAGPRSEATRNIALDLVHGTLTLPAFLPDATLGVVRAVDATDLEGAGIEAVVMNVFHLMQKPGSSTIAALRCSCGSRRGWTWKVSGMLTWDSAIRFTVSEEIAVFTATGNSACGSDTGPAVGWEVTASRTSVKTFSSWPW